MRWEDIDFGAAWWTIPPEMAKNGRSHRVPLRRQAKAMLAEIKLQARPGPWVFPNPTKTGAMQTTQKAAERIVKRTGVECRQHDLRRTAASHMTGMGIPRLVVGKILNHVEPGVSAVGIDVAMIQSLLRNDEVDDVVAEYGHVIVDECHHVPAVSFERVASKMSTLEDDVTIDRVSALEAVPDLLPQLLQSDFPGAVTLLARRAGARRRRRAARLRGSSSAARRPGRPSGGTGGAAAWRRRGPGAAAAWATPSETAETG